MEPVIKPIKQQESILLKDSPIIIWYVLGIIAGLFILPFKGIIFALQVGLTIFVFLILNQAFWRYAKQAEWYRIVVELFVPGFLWLLFCVGGIINFLNIDGVIDYGPVDDITIILMSVFAMIGAISYVLVFRFVYRTNVVKTSAPPLRRIIILLIILLLFDWFVRYQLIQDGLYFTWLMRLSFADSIRGTNILFHIQRTIWLIIFPLLLYVISKTRRFTRLILAIFLVVQLILVVSAGDRRFILYSGVVILASYGMIYKISINRKLVILGFILIVTILGILSPMIQEARFIMIRDGTDLMADPTQIPSRFFFEYLPQVTNPESILNSQLSGRKSTVARIGSYINYGANIYQAVIDGKPLLGIDEFGNAMLMLVPRILYPGKQIQDADYVVQEHFRIGWPGFDANGTYIADIFAYFHFPGIVVLFSIAGLSYGLLANHLVTNYGLIGTLILIGLLPIFIPMGDSFSEILVYIRNVTLFLLMVKLILHYGVSSQTDYQTSL